MNPFENPENIKLLRDLLRDPDIPSSDSEDDDEGPARNTNNFFGPGNIGPKSSNRAKKNDQTKSKNAEQKPLLGSPKQSPEKSKDAASDVDRWLEQQEQEDRELLEDRKRPEYTVKYKQAVGTEDVYLQMGNRTAASMSCEDMVIDVKLPEEKVTIEAMSLSVTEDEIDLKTPVYRLKLPLAQKIDPDKGKAKYDADTKVLTLTLRMQRELDFVNF